jgi:hypothetical protein
MQLSLIQVMANGCSNTIISLPSLLHSLISYILISISYSTVVMSLSAPFPHLQSSSQYLAPMATATAKNIAHITASQTSKSLIAQPHSSSDLRRGKQIEAKNHNVATTISTWGPARLRIQ